MMNFNCKMVQKKEVYFPTQVTAVKFLCYVGRHFISGNNVVEKSVTHTHKKSNFVAELIFVTRN